MARRASREGQPVLLRVLMFVAVVGASAGVAVISAHQDLSDAGFGITMVGTIAIGGILWVVAWWRKGWRLRDDNGLLTVTLAGVIAVSAAGSSAVTEMVLATRGEPVDVIVVAYSDADSDGYRSYVLLPKTESSSVPGDIRTDQVFEDGQTVTVLVDPDGFVRPKLPDDVNSPTFVVIVVAGIALLAVSMIGFGFPLRAGRRAGAEKDSP